MVIYGDILFIVNMTVDYLLIGLTALIIKTDIKLLRQIVASVIGGVSAFYIFLDIESFFIDILYRFSVSALMMIIVFGVKKYKRLLRALLINLTLSLLLSGIADMLVSVLKTSVLTVNNTVIYIGISPLLLISVSVLFYFTTKIIFRFRKNSFSREHCDIKLSLRENSASFKALVDSGNSITDIMSDSEIFVVSEDVIKTLCGTDIDSFFEKDENKTRCRLIPTKTVTGTTVLKAIRCDKAFVNIEEEAIELSKPIIALSKQDYSDEYDIIIPLGALKGR